MHEKIRKKNSDQVSCQVELKIRPKHLTAFSELSEEMAYAAAEESGTLIFERYVDVENNSQAAVVHLANFREQFAVRFSPLVERTGFRFYGQPNAELTLLLSEILTPMSLDPIPLLVGFNRMCDNPSA